MLPLPAPTASHDVEPPASFVATVRDLVASGAIVPVSACPREDLVGCQVEAKGYAGSAPTQLWVPDVPPHTRLKLTCTRFGYWPPELEHTYVRVRGTLGYTPIPPEPDYEGDVMRRPFVGTAWVYLDGCGVSATPP